MSFRCHNCEAELNSDIAQDAKSVRCESCGSIVETNFSGQTNKNVGIHPALEKRYGQIEQSSITNNSTVLQSPTVRDRPKHKKTYRRRLENDSDFDQIVPRIPGYELMESIGKGAMGTVYKARHLSSGRDAAVKVLSSELTHRRDLVARFEREAAALRAFRNPNVVAIFDSGSYGHTHYYGMEFIDGINLRRFLKKGPLSPSRAVRYMRIVLQGLKAAHDRGIIHRDLKPENILIEKPNANKEERVVLVDFGLAGIVNESADPHPNLTRSKVTMGTVNYMAPEQHVDAKRADFRSDLYACGVILYECIAGDLPLGRYLLPTERGINVPASIDACLSKALARNIKDRYQTAQEFGDELKVIEAELKNFMPANMTKISSLPKVKTSIPARPEAASPSDSIISSYKTRFASVSSWVKKPTFAYGILALIVGLVAGIIVSQRTPNEVVVSSEGAQPIYAHGSFEAPAPVFQSKKGNIEVANYALTNSENTELFKEYESNSPVWSYENGNIAYLAKQGDAGHFRRDLSFAVAPVIVPESQTIFKGKVFLQKVRLPIKLAKSQHLARKILGGTPEIAAGGFFYVNEEVDRAIGMMVFIDGTCGMAEFQKQDNFFRFVQYERGGCHIGNLNKPLDVSLQCNVNNGFCQGYVKGRKVSEIRVDNMTNDQWKIALGCRNTNCKFQ